MSSPFQQSFMAKSPVAMALKGNQDKLPKALQQEILNSPAKQTIKLSDEDLNWLYPDVGITAAAKMLMKRTSAKLLVVTLGSEGAFSLANGHLVTVKSAPVINLRDTVGAGDTFMATLLSYLEQRNALTADALVGMDVENIEKLLNYAACAAALNCEEYGCNPPSLNALRKACV